MNEKKMSMDDFLKKGFYLFGIDRNDWKFICPVCETIISVEDYKKEKAPEGAIAYSCIGRYIKNSQKAFGDKKIIKGQPCDYTTGGLLNISPIEIDGQRYFDFYENK
jgi:hypothetical protein